MNIELINTGSELMLGAVLNTHQQWLCRQLADRGYVITRQVAVADAGLAIRDAVREALGRADLVITTGGLGPTSDDITRDLIAELLDLKLNTDVVALAHVEEFFAQRKKPMPASCAIQAQVPEGATVLMNAHGTAPGLVLEVSPASEGGARLRRASESTPGHGSTESRPTSSRPTMLVMLPGPPRELRPMFTTQVLPLIQSRLPLEAEFVCRTIRTTGIGESFAEERIAGPLKHLTDAGLELGYCARTGEVDLRVIARGDGALKTVDAAEAIIRAQVGEHVFGTGEESLEAVLVRELTARKQTLALAESCTGGFLANRITNVSGVSAVLLAGLVTYSNEAKMKFLGVRGETLGEHGAVSEPTAREMAEGARRVTGADFALAVTGIAGPTGGTASKPVGTVFIALTGGGETKVINPLNRYDRETFKFVTSQQALELLRRRLLASPLL